MSRRRRLRVLFLVSLLPHPSERGGRVRSRNELVSPRQLLGRFAVSVIKSRHARKGSWEEEEDMRRLFSDGDSSRAGAGRPRQRRPSASPVAGQESGTRGGPRRDDGSDLQAQISLLGHWEEQKKKKETCLFSGGKRPTIPLYPTYWQKLPLV